MYGVFTLTKAQIKKLYDRYSNIRLIPEGNEVLIAIPKDPNEMVVVINKAGDHLGYIPFKGAWNL